VPVAGHQEPLAEKLVLQWYTQNLTWSFAEESICGEHKDQEMVLAAMSDEDRAAALAAMSPEDRAAALAAMSPEARAAAPGVMSSSDEWMSACECVACNYL